jgi:hypothetical protein
MMRNTFKASPGEVGSTYKQMRLFNGSTRSLHRYSNL